jgi:hypothetical protein
MVRLAFVIWDVGTKKRPARRVGERVGENLTFSDSRQPLAPRIGVVVVIIVMNMSKPGRAPSAA